MPNLTQDQIFLLNLNISRVELLYYTCITVIPCGIALNIISSIVFMRKKFSKKTMGFYNIVISIVNIIFAVFAALNYTGIALGKDLTLMSGFSCVFLTYGQRVFSQMSSWMNVFVTVDRMISITYPNRYPFLKNKKILTLLIFIQFLLLCIINIPNLFFKIEYISTFNPVSNMTVTTKSCTSSSSIVTIRDMIVIMFKVVIPIILMISMNIYLMHKLVKEKKKFKKISELNKEYHFAFSIFFMNVLYTLIMLPGLITLIYLNIIQYAQTSNIQSREVIIAQFAYSVALVIITYEFFFTFFVNIVFNKIFRKEFLIFVKQILGILPKSYVNDSQNFASDNKKNSNVMKMTSVNNTFIFK